MEMSRLTRDGTAEPVSRDQILRHERGQRNNQFSCQLTSYRTDNFTRLIHTLTICVTIHTKSKGSELVLNLVYNTVASLY